MIQIHICFVLVAQIILKPNPSQPFPPGWNAIPLVVGLKKDFFYSAGSMSFTEQKVSIDLCKLPTITLLIMK